MKAIYLLQYGGPQDLRYGEVPVPQCKDNEVLVKVCAASVNPVDYKHASGALERFFPFHPPWVPGRDFSGIVEKVGKNVKKFKPKDEVYGIGSGTYAEFAIANNHQICFKPQILSHSMAASVPLAAQTAWEALFDHGHLRENQKVLIHAAAGGVGSFAVQLAHQAGAIVFTTASFSNQDYLKTLGADVVIDYETTSFESICKEFDLVLETIGGEIQDRSFPCLKKGGHLIATTQEPSKSLSKQYQVHAEMMQLKGSCEQLDKISNLIKEKKLKISIAESFSLPNAPKAWEKIMAKHVRGKIIINISNTKYRK